MQLPMKSLRRFLLLAGLIAVASDCGIVSGGPTSTGAPVIRTVEVKDDRFDPDTINTVPAPAVVAWTWVGQNRHSVTFDNESGGAAASSPTQSAGTFERHFAVAGVFNYRCTEHPDMTGTINVRPDLIP